MSNQRGEGNRKLLRLAKLLEGITPEQAQVRMPDGQTGFTMSVFVHSCGAPACALGWWASAHSKRWKVRENMPVLREIDDPTIHSRPDTAKSAMIEFDISRAEFDRLFGFFWSCDEAGDNPQKAAAYIRHFVAQRQAQPRRKRNAQPSV